MKKTAAISLLATITLSACVSTSGVITPSYVSPLMYQTYHCDQLTLEAQRIRARISKVGARSDRVVSNDKTTTRTQTVFFWPARFFFGGAKQQEANYARLMGEYDALQQVAIAKKCPALVPVAQ